MKKRRFFLRALLTLGGACLGAGIVINLLLPAPKTLAGRHEPTTTPPRKAAYEPRRALDASGYGLVMASVDEWAPDAPLERVAASWRRVGYRKIEEMDRYLRQAAPRDRVNLTFMKSILLNYEGEAEKAYEVLTQLRKEVEPDDNLAGPALYGIIYLQGVTALRRGENDNCIMCRGESSCILPISQAAVHLNTEGSRLAIGHFTEYLRRFPDDLEVRWLLNLAHMTLGEYPDGVDPKQRINLDRFVKSEFDIGRFRDIGHVVGVNRFNQAGGAVMEDFDGDGLLDLAVTSFDPTMNMAYYRNTGGGKFEERTKDSGLVGQLGGLNCVQGDFDNDGRLDLFICRGAWLPFPIRPTLLRNLGDGRFADVTREAGMLTPVNSNSATWGDYDNDGFLDLFVCCEKQSNRLYHNRGDGTFEEVAGPAGLGTDGTDFCKGANWIDIDNDDYPDLFVNNLTGPARLYQNNRDGHFTDVGSSLGIDGPTTGFSCWAWDYDNDGWLDIYANSYDRTLGDIVKGILGQRNGLLPNKLYRNLGGKGFKDVAAESGLDKVFACMGSNFADFDNDGYLDMYLGTGEPSLATLAPNRMFKNVGGARFSEITGTSGTGHLQKGHGVACGDWDRDGSVDLFIQMGGATNGDKYHNILFQNPGQKNHWLTVKVVGKKSNRSAIGARIKVVTADPEPLTVHRHVSSGSSFGANPLQQTVGLGRAGRVAVLEIHWPTSGTTQVFRDIAADQAIEVTEFAEEYRKLDWKPVAGKR